MKIFKHWEDRSLAGQAGHKLGRQVTTRKASQKLGRQVTSYCRKASHKLGRKVTSWKGMSQARKACQKLGKQATSWEDIKLARKTTGRAQAGKKAHSHRLGRPVMHKLEKLSQAIA